MKAVVAAFNQEKALVGGLLRDYKPSDLLRMELFQALLVTRLTSLEARDDLAGAEGEGEGNAELSRGLDEVAVVQEQRVLCRHPLARAGEGLAVTLKL